MPKNTSLRSHDCEARRVDVWLVYACSPQSSILTSDVSPFISTPFAAEIHSTLLHLSVVSAAQQSSSRVAQYLMSTCPNVPVGLRLMYSSVPESWMFMYESTLISLPLYSV